MPAPTRSVYVHGPNTLYAQTQRDYDYNRHKHELEELLLPHVTRRMAPHPPPERKAGLRPWMQQAPEEMTRSTSDLDPRARQAQRRARTKQKRRDAHRARHELATLSTSEQQSAPRDGPGSFHSSDELNMHVGFMLGHIERQHARADEPAVAAAARAAASGHDSAEHQAAARVLAKNARSAVTGFAGAGGGGPPGMLGGAGAPQPGGELVSRVAGRRESDALREQGLFSRPERLKGDQVKTSTGYQFHRRGSTLAMAQQGKDQSGQFWHSPNAVRARARARANAPLAATTPSRSHRAASLPLPQVETKSYMDRLDIDSRAQRELDGARNAQQRQAAATIVTKSGGGGGLYTIGDDDGSEGAAQLAGQPRGSRASRGL